MNNYGQKTIRNIPPDGLVNRKILPVCAYSYVKTKNDFINGENITIDGGMTKKMIYWE